MESTHKDILKNHKLSLTAVRLAILDALETKPHSDAEQLFKLVKHKISTTSKQAIVSGGDKLVH